MIIESIKDPRFIYLSEQVALMTDDTPGKITKHSCELLAHLLEAHGFDKYRKADRVCIKKCNEFTFEVSFGTNYKNNERGKFVELNVYALVRSKIIADHCKGLNWYWANEGLGGGQLGNLVKPHSWLTWDLPKPERRPKDIGSAYNRIQKIAFPYFENFENAKQLTERFDLEYVIDVDPNTQLQMIMYYFGVERAKEVAEKFLSRHPEIHDEYLEKLNYFADPSAVPSGFRTQAHMLAYLAKRL